MLDAPTPQAGLAVHLDDLRASLADKAGRNPVLAPLLALILDCLRRLVALLGTIAAPAVMAPPAAPHPVAQRHHTARHHTARHRTPRAHTHRAPCCTAVAARANASPAIRVPRATRRATARISSAVVAVPRCPHHARAPPIAGPINRRLSPSCGAAKLRLFYFDIVIITRSSAHLEHCRRFAPGAADQRRRFRGTSRELYRVRVTKCINVNA